MADMENIDKYLLEFLERMNRPASFPDRKVARHLSEIFISWMDLILVAVKINAQPKLYNATQEEYEAFINVCKIINFNEANSVAELLRTIANTKSKRHAHVFKLSFNNVEWRECEKKQPSLQTGSRIRLFGIEVQENTKTRELFLYVDFTKKPGIWIELYCYETYLSANFDQLVNFCDKVKSYLLGEDLHIILSGFKLAGTRDDQQDTLMLDKLLTIQHVAEPKVLLPYVERSMMQMIQLIQRSIDELRNPEIDYRKLSTPVGNSREILPEFIFTILIARDVIEPETLLIPNKLGYLLTVEQIHAIRNYIRINNDRIVDELNPLIMDSDRNILKDLLETSNKVDADSWIDRLQNFEVVNVDHDGNPTEHSYGISSYVVRTQQVEYVTHLKEDPRIAKQSNYPLDVRFIEDQFIHGNFLLMIPIFLGGKVAAIFWTISNIPIAPEVRFTIMSVVRKYDYLISNAIIIEWRILRKFVTEKEQKILSGWLNALEDLAIHPLTRVQRNLSMLSTNTLNYEKNTSDIDFVIKIIRFFARPDEAPDKSDRVHLSEILYSAFEEEKMRKHVTLDIGIDRASDPVFHTNRVLLTEALRNPIENSYHEALRSPEPFICIRSMVLPDEQMVLLKIWDSGPKFPFQVLKDLFKGRVASTHQGMGVGLNITHLILKKLGGDIEVDSTDQKTVNIKIPL